jgi:hypothetical protein
VIIVIIDGHRVLAKRQSLRRQISLARVRATTHSTRMLASYASENSDLARLSVESVFAAAARRSLTAYVSNCLGEAL